MRPLQRPVFNAFVVLVATFALASCGYSRTQVTLVGTPAPAKTATFEPAILDRLPLGKPQVVAEATKNYRSVTWAKDACRDLGCDAAVIVGRKPRQVANLIQMDASAGGSSGSTAPQTHTVYDEFFYQFLVLP